MAKPYQWVSGFVLRQRPQKVFKCEGLGVPSVIAGAPAMQKACCSLEVFHEVLVLLVYFAETVFQKKNSLTGASLPKSSQNPLQCIFNTPFQEGLRKGSLFLNFLRRFMYLLQPQEGLRELPLLERVPSSPARGSKVPLKNSEYNRAVVVPRWFVTLMKPKD